MPSYVNGINQHLKVLPTAQISVLSIVQNKELSQHSLSFFLFRIVILSINSIKALEDPSKIQWSQVQLACSVGSIKRVPEFGGEDCEALLSVQLFRQSCCHPSSNIIFCMIILAGLCEGTTGRQERKRVC
jgi:hypothetical protein